MQTTLQPAFTAGTICGSISPMLLCVLMQTTSGFCARTASNSVVILTSHGRPSSSPTVLPSLAGLVTMTPQRSMSFGRSRMYPRRPWPIMPVPHSATLIMCRSSSRGCNHAYKLCKESHSSPVLSTEVAAGARRRTCVMREASRPAADGCCGAGREAGAGALRRAALEGAGRPCRARGWKALCPSSLLGRGGAGQRTPTGAPHAMWAAGSGQPFAPRPRRLLPADLPAQLREARTHRARRHVQQIQRRVEPDQQTALEALEDARVDDGMNGDCEVLFHPRAERRLRSGRHEHGPLHLQAELAEERRSQREPEVGRPDAPAQMGVGDLLCERGGHGLAGRPLRRPSLADVDARRLQREAEAPAELRSAVL